MKLGAALTLVGLGAAAVTFVVNQGCGDSATDAAGSGAAQTGKVPPPEVGAATTATETRTFALNSISLGEADRSGNKNKDAWKKYGYNLDSRVTTVADQKSPDLSYVCQRAKGAPASVHQDGDQGTDNTFGKEVLKLLDPFTPTPSKTINDTIAKGTFTIMFKVVGLTDEPAQSNTGLSGTLLVGGEYGTTPPAFDSTTDWPYFNDPQVAINGAYINKGVFVNGQGGATVKLSISISGQQLNLTINKAIISFTHDPATKSLTDGTIAGVINTEEFVSGIGSVAGRFSTDLCEGATVNGIKDSIRQASDMLSDGSQDPSKPCDGISAALGFTAKQVGNPTKETTPGEAPPDPCDPNAVQPDAGTDSGQQQ